MPRHSKLHRVPIAIVLALLPACIVSADPSPTIVVSEGDAAPGGETTPGTDGGVSPGSDAGDDAATRDDTTARDGGSIADGGVSEGGATDGPSSDGPPSDGVTIVDGASDGGSITDGGATDSSSDAATPIEIGVVGGDPMTADCRFPKGTRGIKFHFNDPYTYADNREVYVSSFVVGTILGWGTWVYPDSNTLGLKNPTFFFGTCTAPCVGVPAEGPLKDGAMWTFKITVDSAKKADFFGFLGLDGEVKIDAVIPTPAASEIWPSRCLFKAAVGSTATMTFAVKNR